MKLLHFTTYFKMILKENDISGILSEIEHINKNININKKNKLIKLIKDYSNKMIYDGSNNTSIIEEFYNTIYEENLLDLCLFLINELEVKYNKIVEIYKLNKKYLNSTFGIIIISINLYLFSPILIFFILLNIIFILIFLFTAISKYNKILILKKILLLKSNNNISDKYILKNNKKVNEKIDEKKNKKTNCKKESSFLDCELGNKIEDNYEVIDYQVNLKMNFDFEIDYDMDFGEKSKKNYDYFFYDFETNEIILL